MMKDFKCTSGGWQAKIGPGVLSELLSGIDVCQNQDVVLDFTSKDDASVYKLGNEYLFQTLDFFTPNVDDPYIFGQIVAANSLSDIYAMGAEPITCQSIVAFPKQRDISVLQEIMRGCCDKLLEANVSLTGGHSIYDSDVKFGLSVLGLGKTYWKNNGVNDCDVLIHTKKLGTGIILAATNSFDVCPSILDDCYKTMTTLNKYAKQVIEEFPINSCTDITGFGLLGHLFEMIDSTNFKAVIDSTKILFYKQALEYAKNYVYTSSAQQNRKYLEDKVQFANVSNAMQEILFDAQTSGGLLFSVNNIYASQILEKLHQSGCEASIIGRIEKSTNSIIEVI